MRRWTVAVALLAACSGESAPPVAVTPPPPPLVIREILAPSPLELDRQVRAAGLTEGIGALVPTTPPPAPPPEQKDRVAFRTGVVYAHLLLSGRTADKAALLANLTAVAEGMATLGASADLQKTMDTAIVHLRNDTSSREDFLVELDAAVAATDPATGWGSGDQTGPLLQAGAWLAGINLVAKAVVAKADPAAADALLRHPEIPRYFLDYVHTGAGADKVGVFLDSVKSTLTTMEAIAKKPRLDLADAAAVVEATDALLQLN